MMRTTVAMVALGVIATSISSEASQLPDVPTAAVQTLTDRLARAYSDGDTAILDSIYSHDFEYVEIDRSGTIVIMKPRAEELAYFDGFTHTLNFISANVSIDADSWRWVPAPRNKMGGSADLKCDVEFSFTASDSNNTFTVNTPASFVLSRGPGQSWKVRRWSQDFSE